MFGRFTLRKVLGRGGMGIVWLAYDEELQRDVAMKFLPEMLTRDEEAINDLKRETRRSLDLTHHHIVRIYDFTQDGESAAIVMEYVDGDSLSTLKTRQPGGCFGVSEIARWVGHFCLALDYAHRQARVVHRDLKPANLMINSRGDLKVTDFGISRSLSDSMTRVSQSNSAGTLAYMSPEQALGSSPAPADDIYAFGATLYDLLTGRPPFFRGNLQVQLENVMPPPMMQRRAELEHEAEPIPELWEEVIRSCLAKRPEDRPQSLLEVGNALGLFGAGTTTARPAPKPAEAAPVAASVRMPKTTKPSVTSLDEILGDADEARASASASPDPLAAAAAKPPAAFAPPEPPTQALPSPSVAAPAKGGRPAWPLGLGAAAVLVALTVFIATRQPDREMAAVPSTPPASTPVPPPVPATPDPERVAADKLASVCEQAIAKGDFTAARRDLATLEAFTPPDPRAAGLRGRLEEAEARARQSELATRLAAVEKALAARNGTAAREAIARVLEIQDDPRLGPLRKALAQLEAPPSATPVPLPAATPVRPPVTARDDNRRPPERKKPTPALVRPAREERPVEPPVVRATTPPPAAPAATPRKVSQGAPGT